MENEIATINKVIKYLETVTIQATRRNLDTMLGCIQLLDRVADDLSKVQISVEAENG